MIVISFCSHATMLQCIFLTNEMHDDEWDVEKSSIRVFLLHYSSALFIVFILLGICSRLHHGIRC